MQLIHVVHQTTYTFDQAVTLRPHRLLLRPRDGFDLRIRQSGLSITPTPALYWQRDAFNNSVAIAVFDQPTLQLDIVSTLTLEQYQTDGLNLSQLLPNPVLDHDLEPEAAVLQAYQTSRLALSDLPQSLTEGLSRACAAHEQFLALQGPLRRHQSGHCLPNSRDAWGTDLPRNARPRQWELPRSRLAANRGGSRVRSTRSLRFWLPPEPSI